VDFTEEEAMSVVSAVKEFSLQHKRLLTDGEFDTIMESVLAGGVTGSIARL
jgi:hypothetical protein